MPAEPLCRRKCTAAGLCPSLHIENRRELYSEDDVCSVRTTFAGAVAQRPARERGERDRAVQQQSTALRNCPASCGKKTATTAELNRSLQIDTRISTVRLPPSHARAQPAMVFSLTSLNLLSIHRAGGAAAAAQPKASDLEVRDITDLVCK